MAIFLPEIGKWIINLKYQLFECPCSSNIQQRFVITSRGSKITQINGRQFTVIGNFTCLFEDSLLVESIDNAVSVAGVDSSFSNSSVAAAFDLVGLVFGGRAVEEQDKAVKAEFLTHALQVSAGLLWSLWSFDSEDGF